MKKLHLFYALFFCLWTSLEAGDLPKDDWNVGEIMLNNGEILKGEIQYDLKQNVAMIKKKGLVKAFGAYNIDYFRFMDSARSMIRSFYSMPYSQKNGQERLMFFELVFEDGFALFNRELSVPQKHAVLAERPYIQREDKGVVSISSYYIFTLDGNFQKIETEASDLADKLSLDRKEKKEMEKFIIENQLDLNYASDFIKVIYEVVQNDIQS
ncbi:hypothetical protein [Catalinimonas niigatensis]|uniref:hypothetical protein n=1 Tax=Catalinimonas niigatensis TaxID=1397264 RepID=UPI0026658AB5|nr:hypothetical protein [Catalinimonas niigatensis]WPP50211.1 hypothetical protein PZB72_26455 [Catalinimonas niigatensis]